MNPPNRPPFPEVLDSTIIAAFRSCPRKAQLEFLEHWKMKTPSVHLHAGAAYAKGLEVARTAFFQEGRDEETSIALGLKSLITAYGDFQCPEDSAKSLERTAGAFEFYMTRYSMPQDAAHPIKLPSGRLGIEFSFAEPIDRVHPETENPLLYVGRMDMICTFADGIFGLDDKTTSSLGASWSRSWDLRSQFTGYCWGAARAGLPLQGFLVRGVSILKAKYDEQQALTYRPAWMIERWYSQLLRDIDRMIQSWESGVWDYSLDHACTEYGGCPFRQVCLSQNPQPWLEGSFERRRWDPVLREEFPVEGDAK
ncbi:MAG: PD-(D/E)XK nuclease family protein [Patescibacteria group bacterium]|nr:PD-(D/E)XK nuclease family protein [Patescibacteria group bacterium]